jgi:hypothetical protein
MINLSYGRQTVIVSCSINEFIDAMQHFMDDTIDVYTLALQLGVKGSDFYHLKLAALNSKSLPDRKYVHVFDLSTHECIIKIGPSKNACIEICNITC